MPPIGSGIDACGPLDLLHTVSSEFAYGHWIRERYFHPIRQPRIAYAGVRLDAIQVSVSKRFGMD